MDANDEIIKVREALKVVQPMIDISADRLNGLRTQCATSVDLTRQEIRTLEGKLLKMFARQLVIKSKLRGDAALIFRDIPSVRQWLQVVGLQKHSIDGICERIDSLESLQEKTDHDLNNILKDRKANPDESRRLYRALFNLKRYTDILQRGDKNTEEPSDLELYWDSWDRHHRHKTSGSLSPHVSRNKALVDQQQNAVLTTTEDTGLTTTTLPNLSLNYYNNNNNNNHEYNSSDSSMSSLASYLQSPPSTPPVNSKKTATVGDKHKFPSTPPPHKKHHTVDRSTTTLLPGSFPLTKSKSHESQLSTRAPENGDGSSMDLLTTQVPVRRGRLPTEPGLSSTQEICGSNSPLNISSATASPVGISPVGMPSSPAPSPVSQLTSPDITSPSPSPAHSTTASSSIPPPSPQLMCMSNIVSPCTPKSNVPSIFNNSSKTPSPLTPGPTNTATPYSSINTTISSSIPVSVSPATSSPIVVSPASLSPIPGSPISPNVSKRFTTKSPHSIGSPHTPRSKFIETSPLITHSTNSATVSPVIMSPLKSPATPGVDSEDSNSSSSLQVPKSPHKNISSSTSGGNSNDPGASMSMRHYIAHRFTKMYKMMTTCDYCDKQMFFVTGLKCRECKFKCHRECEQKVPPSCGLPSELVNVFKRHISPNAPQSQSPNPGQTPMSSPIHHHNNILTNFRRERKRSHPQPTINIAPFIRQDSSSNTSSCNSSTPSSPAVLSCLTPASINKMHFHFPEVDRDITLVTHPLEELAETQTSNDSDKTMSACGSGGSGSTDSERTPVRVDSQESQVSDGEIFNETTRENQRWPRQNSQLSMREWDIPFDEINIGEIIGIGRFGTVYRGNWHGDVAIKVLNMDYLDDDKALEAFKSEVGTFRKTRHENLVLFMGACKKPPKLAIVTSLSKGMTLYTHIHLRKDKFNMNKTTIIAQQISQGMGYLHARGIIHKDLKSKNIFLENGKVVITDFGLFSVTKLCYGNRKGNSLNIPPGWLCYLAPEIVRSLHANQSHRHHELPFSKTSDIYAFGTVWYELLCGEWPFKGQAPEAVIWQVGKGMKQPLANLQASRDVKDILMLCWGFRPNDRPDFGDLFNLLEKLPKKRLARSPSHPVHLSRSAESVF